MPTNTIQPTPLISHGARLLLTPDKHFSKFSKDLIQWYENSMGNCFTFNHENSSKIYNLRYSGERGGKLDFIPSHSSFSGFRAQLKVDQSEYLNFVLTASLLVFLHKKEETIMGESVSYQIAPGEETTFVIQRVRVPSPMRLRCIILA